ncbi:hypothetical protein CAMGR0001_0895 [Campylobacter gracilis RM3268]|uniref:Uncharacterized protein n=1 Tax=Campylobacter gracilis RM3268 TaxID=553220 RepID=C8PGA2_9BACT|nr:hypothetical protein CAMGR0001_0895 [Campylobacter gracilis RM3268]
MAQNKPEIAVDRSTKFRACEWILSRYSTISRVLSGVPNTSGDHFNIDFALTRALQIRHKSGAYKI